MLAMGVPEKPVKFLYSHLTQVTFDVFAGWFKSKKRYGGTYISFGSGKGGGASGFHWLITQDTSNKALENHNINKCVIKDPITREMRSNNRIVFADDLPQIAMSNVSPCTPTNNFSKLRNIIQLATKMCIRGVFLHPKIQLSKSVIEQKWCRPRCHDHIQHPTNTNIRTPTTSSNTAVRTSPYARSPPHPR